MTRLADVLHLGGRLRARLLALILIPLLGMAAAVAGQVVSQVQSARASANAVERIKTAADADAVRASFQEEVVPAFAAAVAKQPGLINTNLNSDQLLGALSIVGRLPELRATTDAAVSRLATHTGMGELSANLLTGIASWRKQVDTATTFDSKLALPTALIDTVTNVENTELARATSGQLSDSARNALVDLQLVARATQVGAGEMVQFCATKFDATFINRAVQEASWVTLWANFTVSVDEVTSRASALTVARWQSAMKAKDIVDFNAFMAADALHPKSVALSGLLNLVNSDGTRNRAFASVLNQTIATALGLGNSQHRKANLQLLWIVLGGLVLIGLSIVSLFLVQRSVSGPLQRLAVQAQQISHGELTDVDTGGPYEVRTVANALRNSVATLRNIQAQAAAVAAGDLDSPVVHTSLPGPLGEVVHSSVMSIISAVNEKELARNELAHRASHDALTELPNRAHAMALIDQSLHRAQRAGSKTALMFVDLDRFKAVNDTHGHAAGDEVLRVTAQRMRSAVREGDSVARLGGDEFIVLLEGVQDEADTVSLAERMVSLIGQPTMINDRDVRIGASIGLAFCRDGYVDADRLLQEADAAAYRAKEAGRDRVEVFDDVLRAQLKDRASTEDAIRDGLVNGEFLLYYQPVVNLVTGTTDGVEALIRWDRPGHGMVPPNLFIPVAEQSSLINDIGRWVLIEACRQLTAWQQAGLGNDQMTVSVNISGRHIASSEFVSDVKVALDAAGLVPNRLIVEITETVLVDDPMATRNMHTIRDLGVRVAIDDFGTGFTSIGQLPKLPVDSLKIDRSFVSSEEPANVELVRLIVAAAHAFGLVVVAEGIEYMEQADGLRNLDVEKGQGFLFSRPRPAETVFDRTRFEARSIAPAQSA